MGCGDFSCYVEEDGDYIYLFYNMLKENLEKDKIEDIDVYVARSRKRFDGMMGDFVNIITEVFAKPEISAKKRLSLKVRGTQEL